MLPIIDSRASDHMTNSFIFFQSYELYPCNKNIKIASGGFSPITGKGSIQISQKICINFVLHILKLAYNLLCVSKLSKESNCLVTFYDSLCLSR